MANGRSHARAIATFARDDGGNTDFGPKAATVPKLRQWRLWNSRPGGDSVNDPYPDE